MPKPELARTLTFSTMSDLLEDARAIAQQPDTPVRGNWTASQNVWHIARFVQASVEGFPFTAPLPLRLVGPLMRSRVLSKPITPGFKAPARIAEHMDPQRQDPALTAMGPAIALLEEWVVKAEGRGFIPANPIFGKLSRDQWIALHCRHAELHFGLVDLKA